MSNFKKIEKFAYYLNESIPKLIQDITCNSNKIIQKILKNQLNQMNLVSREEFYQQTQILLKIQKQLKNLEKKNKNPKKYAKKTIIKK